MKKRLIYVFFPIVTLAFILIDQIAKILIKNSNSDIISTTSVHIHPQLNAEGVEAAARISDFLNIDIHVVLIVRALFYIFIFVLFILAYVGFHVFIFWGCQKKTYKTLNFWIISIAAAALLCSFFADELFWGGSLDWICITWLGNHSAVSHHVTSYHYTFDIKDIYLFIAMILTIVRGCLFLYTYQKSTPDEKKQFSDRLKHPIQNIKDVIRYYKGEEREELSHERKNQN